jgi:site-specific DNA recombinase
VSQMDVIYARYSSDMQRDASCEDQEREVRQGLTRKDIDPRDALVINDRAESGTKNNRAEFERLRAMIRRGEVRILAVDDQSRLSRADNVFDFIKDLVYSGGRFISTGENIDTDEEGWELRVKVMELHNSTTIRELGRRVHRGQKGRVLDDGAAGDHPYGYESYHLDPNWAEASRRGPKPKKGLRVHETQARWVRQAFAWFVGDGRSISEIARELTRLGIDKGTKGTAKGWHHAQVRRMLGNEKYAGRWVWGASKSVRNSEGNVKRVALPPDQWVVRDRPELRIIDEATWARARERLAELEAVYGQKEGQRRRGAKPHHTEVYPKSLLGGLIDCHACGSRLWVRGSETRYLYLGCPNHAKGTCPMAAQVSVERAERALLGFATSLLTSWPGWLERATAAMRSEVAASAALLPDSLRADEVRLAELRRKVDNLVEQLAEGDVESPALRRRLAELEREAGALDRRVGEGRGAIQAAVKMPDDGWIKARLAELPALLGDDSRLAAPLLRRLLGRVTAEAMVAPGKVRGYVRLHVNLEAQASLKEVLGGRLPDSMLALAASTCGEGPMTFDLDLGGPSRRDVWAPRIAEMRAGRMTWEEIGRVTGLGTGNAHNVWKRWTDAQKAAPAIGP